MSAYTKEEQEQIIRLDNNCQVGFEEAPLEIQPHPDELLKTIKVSKTVSLGTQVTYKRKDFFLTINGQKFEIFEDCFLNLKRLKSLCLALKFGDLRNKLVEDFKQNIQVLREILKEKTKMEELIKKIWKIYEHCHLAIIAVDDYKNPMTMNLENELEAALLEVEEKIRTFIKDYHFNCLSARDLLLKILNLYQHKCDYHHSELQQHITNFKSLGKDYWSDEEGVRERMEVLKDRYNWERSRNETQLRACFNKLEAEIDGELNSLTQEVYDQLSRERNNIQFEQEQLSE